MIEAAAIFIAGFISGSLVVGGYVYWKIRKIKKQMFGGDLGFLDP